MGYDFMFEKAKDISNVRFPCQYGEFELDEGTFPWNELKEHILSLGATEQDFRTLGSDMVNYRLGLGDKGELYVHGTDTYASLDVHADWSVILELFSWLRDRDPRIVLADLDVGNYHDQESFRQFMSECKNA
jgi:hypothetical protein